MNHAVTVRRTEGAILLGFEEWPEPEAAPLQLIVEPEFVGVCGSDLELLAGHLDDKLPVEYPVVLGHEWSGRVASIGEGVSGFEVGQLVIGHGVLGPDQWFGLTGPRGAMANRFAIEAKSCFAVPASVSAKQAAMIEPIACVLTGLRHAGGIDAGATAVVFGCGTLGLAMIGVLAATGATVIAVDPSAARREIAHGVGASVVLPAADGESLAANLRDTIGVPYVDLVVEASGNPRAQAATFSLTRRRSRILFMGLASQTADSVPLRFIHERELIITSSNGASPDIWDASLKFVESTGLDLTSGVSNVFSFSEIERAIATARSPESGGKVMLAPSTE